MTGRRVLLAAAAWAACSMPAAAQDWRSSPYSYTRPPALSPYLGLALGRDPAVNYFLGVRGVMDQRLNERLLGNTIVDFERRWTARPEADSDLFPVLPGTGHPTAFVNYGSYFGGGRSAAPPARRPGR